VIDIDSLSASFDAIASVDEPMQRCIKKPQLKDVFETILY